MPTLLKTALVLGTAAILVAAVASIGFFTPSNMTPMTAWVIFGVVLAVWITAFVVGLTINPSKGWIIAGIGCVIGGVAIMAYGRAQGALMPLLVGAAVVSYSMVSTLLRDELRKQKHSE